MNTQDKRFRAAALGDGHDADLPADVTGLGSFDFARSLEWPFAPHAGIRSLAVHYTIRGSKPIERFVLAASWGTGITGLEISVGLDLDMEPLDTK